MVALQGYLVSTLKVIIEEKEKLLHLLKIEKSTNERFNQEATGERSICSRGEVNLNHGPVIGILERSVVAFAW